MSDAPTVTVTLRDSLYVVQVVGERGSVACTNLDQVRERLQSIFDEYEQRPSFSHRSER
jgi:hypothetical protein